MNSSSLFSERDEWQPWFELSQEYRRHKQASLNQFLSTHQELIQKPIHFMSRNFFSFPITRRAFTIGCATVFLCASVTVCAAEILPPQQYKLSSAMTYVREKIEHTVKPKPMNFDQCRQYGGTIQNETCAWNGQSFVSSAGSNASSASSLSTNSSLSSSQSFEARSSAVSSSVQSSIQVSSRTSSTISSTQTITTYTDSYFPQLRIPNSYGWNIMIQDFSSQGAYTFHRLVTLQNGSQSLQFDIYTDSMGGGRQLSPRCYSSQQEFPLKFQLITVNRQRYYDTQTTNTTPNIWNYNFNGRVVTPQSSNFDQVYQNYATAPFNTNPIPKESVAVCDTFGDNRVFTVNNTPNTDTTRPAVLFVSAISDSTIFLQQADEIIKNTVF